MGFRMILELRIPDQDAPNALDRDQQQLIERFRRDVVGAETCTVYIAEDGDINGPKSIFSSGSTRRDAAPVVD